MNDLDRYLTTDPNDVEVCEHSRPHPCFFCLFAKLMEQAESDREERHA